ncbi:MAG TPA: HPr-rel-A system PqqD family peptide chaperone [Gemmatimonadaceae bacterium]|nr:HPr-rel-A system PqqD family peptide chaperone [Gemmatimonadaceae bacterium]
MISLARMRTDVLRHQLEDQVLVYDPRENAVHLLDPTTACVMDLLIEGGRTVEEITAEVAARTGYEPSPGLIMLALEELRRTKLLDESEAQQKPLSGAVMFRRGMLKKVASAGAATLLVPLIVTMSPGTAQAQSSACIPHDACCETGRVCCNAKDTCEANKNCPLGRCH